MASAMEVINSKSSTSDEHLITINATNNNINNHNSNNHNNTNNNDNNCRLSNDIEQVQYYENQKFINNNLQTINFNNNNIHSNNANVELKNTDANQSTTFGWYNFRPKCLQHFLSAKWALFWLCWAGALQGLVVNGCINVVITTIERRFGLRSSQTGLVASGYDIASFICLVPVTYFGGRITASKPKWIGWGVVLMGLGSLTFAMPHFVVGPYRATGADSNICILSSSSSSGGLNESQSISSSCALSSSSSSQSINHLDNENVSWNIWFFFVAQLLHGAGASPLFTLGVTYIDENVSKKMSSVYLGIYYTMAIIGPAIGYVIGGQLLLFYTDFVTVDASTLGLTPQSKVWVGAWWIGFLFVAVTCVLLSIPLFAYPKTLPGSYELQSERISEAHNGGNNNSSSNTNSNNKNNTADVNNTNNDSTTKQFTKIRELPGALCNLLKNPTFFYLNLAGASEGLIIAGFAAFLPKQIENQFSVTAIYSALLMGIITVPAGGGGTFLGGYLVKKYNLTCAGIIKLCLIVTIIATLFTICFYLSCPNLLFAGVTSSYFPKLYSSPTSIDQKTPLSTTNHNEKPPPQSTIMIKPEANGMYELKHACNQKCMCNDRNYEPICGIDGIMYYSPCHAGCTKELNMDNSKVYLDCNCIAMMDTMNGTEDRGYDAINTMCQTDCNNLWIFVSLCFFVMLFTFLATMPALSATLRCVDDEQRSFALGIQWIKVRLFGTIPAPLIFGTLIDETCILWQESCDDAGACLVYNNNYMSKYMLALALIGKSCSVLFFFCAWWYYIPPKHIVQESIKTEIVEQFNVIEPAPQNQFHGNGHYMKKNNNNNNNSKTNMNSNNNNNGRPVNDNNNSDSKIINRY